MNEIPKVASPSAARRDTGLAPARRRRSKLESIQVQRPRCPRCGGAGLAKYRSITDQETGAATWWVRCRDEVCGYRFRVELS